MKTDKAVGVDEIPNSLLRLSAPAVCHNLAWLFKRSLDLGKLPLQWKTRKIMPIHKKGPRITAANCWKILEAIVNRQLYKHLVCNDLLSPYQPGFRRGDSTSLQLFRVVHQLMSAVDTGKATAIVFYDFRKAFDTVWHAGLLLEAVWCWNWWQPLPMVHRLHQVMPAACGSWLFRFISWNASCWSIARFCPWPHSIHPLHKFYHLCYQTSF